MNILDMTGEVGVVAYRVFPIALLPKRVFVIRVTVNRAVDGGNGARESAIDEPPPSGEVVVALRQSYDRVQMVRQNDECLDPEMGLLARTVHRGAQRGNVINQG
jgi:hypothetical protein